MAIVIYSEKPAGYTLSWGTDDKVLSTNESEYSIQHVFPLRNLAPRTDYWYRVNDGQTYYFSTPDTSSTNLFFAVGSDAHFGARNNRPALTWCWYNNPETIGKLSPLFEKYCVDLVFSGHNRQLELLQRSEVTYIIICGGLGGIPDPVRTYASSLSLWYSAGQYGFVTVNISGREANLVFRSPGYLPLKSFTISK